MRNVRRASLTLTVMTQANIRVKVTAEHEQNAIAAQAIIASGLRHECTESWRTDEAFTAIESPRSGWSIVSSVVEDRNSYAPSSLVIAKHSSENSAHRNPASRRRPMPGRSTIVRGGVPPDRHPARAAPGFQ